MEVTTDRAVDERLRADKLDRVEQIHENLVYFLWALPKFFFHAWTKIKLAKGSQFKLLGELNISLSFLQVSNSDEAQCANFENSIASVLADK